MRTNGKRLDYIDALKGLGIILMVLGHMHFGYTNCEKYIFAFHMPLFFLVSGYLYKTPEKLGVSIKKKMKGLLVPYFVFGLGYYFIWLIRHFQSGVDWISPLKAILIISVDGLVMETALWFLMVLFWAWLLYVLIDRFVKDAWVKVSVIIVLSTVGCLWNYVMPTVLPWGWQDALAVQVFLWLGHMYRNFEKRDVRVFHSWRIWGENNTIKKICFIIVGLLVNAVFIYKNGMVNVRTGAWPGFSAAYINAILAVWLYSEMIKCILKNRIIDKVAGTVLKRIGQFSVVWLCTNHPVIAISKRIVGFAGANLESVLFKEVLIVVLAMVILYALTEIIMRTPLKVVFGKREKSIKGLNKI